MEKFRRFKIYHLVQWDHRKAWGEEDSSSPINNSRNAKIPSPKRDTYSPEQQDNPTGVHDGDLDNSTNTLLIPLDSLDKERDVVLARFTYHKRVITSIEWSP
ncbi:hypothetical protein Tco_0335552 [Tanacetum coccineum]